MQMYDPPHPGFILAESFDDNLTIEDAARKMGIAAQTLIDITKGQAPITQEIAFLLAGILPYFNPKTWLGMQAKYDAWQVTHNKQWQQQMLKKHNLAPSFLDGLSPMLTA